VSDSAAKNGKISCRRKAELYFQLDLSFSAVFWLVLLVPPKLRT